jgi:hypothetical protein
MPDHPKGSHVRGVYGSELGKLLNRMDMRLLCDAEAVGSVHAWPNFWLQQGRSEIVGKLILIEGVY